MSLIKRMRKQKAVWWKRSLLPDRFGQYSFDPPIEIDCRWEDRAQEFVNPEGQTTVSRSVVYVDRLMVVGDRLRRGEMESDEPVNPMTITNAYEIRRFDRNPDIRAREELLTAFL